MEKKHGSSLIPYYFRDGNLYVFLQRRTDDAPKYPDMLGGFGGGLESNENNEDALLREIKEELEYTPQKYLLLGIFETDHAIDSYYIEEVSEGFEKNITVREGKGGEWHKALSVIKQDDICPDTQKAVTAMVEKFKKSNI